MKRFLGLDIGDKRIGVAVSDELNMTAQGLDTIYRGNNDEKAINGIKKKIAEKNIKVLVAGIPFRTDSEDGIKKGKQYEKTKEFIRRLRLNIDIPVVLQDERYTTKETKRILSEANIYDRKKSQQLKDKISAQLILQIYLDKL